MISGVRSRKQGEIMERILISAAIILATILVVITGIGACGGGGDETSEPTLESNSTPTTTPMPVPTKASNPIQTPIVAEIKTPAPIPTSTPTLTPIPAVEMTPAVEPVSLVGTEPAVEIMPTPISSPEPETVPQVCSFYGAVTIDGASVPDDTIISAWVDSELVGSVATTYSLYEITIDGEYEGKVVEFRVGSYKASQTSVWESDANTKVDLAVRLGPTVCGFYGSVTIEGGAVPDGTQVSALTDGAVVGSTTTTDSAYIMIVAGEYTGKTITFTVGSYEAMETSTWERGANESVDLTAVLL